MDSKYVILHVSTFTVTLEQSVTEALKDGWRLQGGIAAWIDDQGHTHWAQAMVKEEESDDAK